MRLNPIIAGLFLSLLAGCASPLQVISPDTPISKELGYAGGLFVQRKYSDVTGFTLTNLDTKQEFEIPFISSKEKLRWGVPSEPWITEANFITLPAGKYAITHWFFYNIVTHARNGRVKFRSDTAERSFLIEPGKLMFLGKFEGNFEQSGMHYTESVKALPITSDKAQQAASQANSGLGALRFECLACVP